MSSAYSDPRLIAPDLLGTRIAVVWTSNGHTGITIGRLDAYTHSVRRGLQSYQSGEYLRTFIETEVVLAGCEPLTVTGWRLTNPGEELA